ncbi:MAG: glycoside hydrolase family 127 protein [Flavobacteriaceae bacterium]
MYNTRCGYYDFDVHKVIEGAVYSLYQHLNPEKYLNDLIDLVRKARKDNGYLFTVKTILGVSKEHPDSKKSKWVEIKEYSHKLYNVSHMYATMANMVALTEDKAYSEAIEKR